MTSSDEEILGSLRHFDNDRYLTCLFAPAEKRAHLVALYAFNLEIAKTAEVVQEPMLGQIRLQWWREALAEIFSGTPRRHDVVEALAVAVTAGDLPEYELLALIDAREFDLAGDAPENLAALEDYARGSSSRLVTLALRTLGCDSPAALAVGESVGLAWALTGLLRAIPFHARQKRLYLPDDLIAEVGLERGDLFELRGSPALQAVVESLVLVAEKHLTDVRRERRHVPKQGRAALLPAVLASGYLKTLRRAAFDPFDPAVQDASPGRVWRLAWAYFFGRT